MNFLKIGLNDLNTVYKIYIYLMFIIYAHCEHLLAGWCGSVRNVLCLVESLILFFKQSTAPLRVILSVKKKIIYNKFVLIAKKQ